MTTPQCFDIADPEGLALTLTDLGATWLSCRVPMADGSRREVLLGCPTPQVQAQQTAYLGATIGRYANRIGNARITLGERSWSLEPQPGSAHQLHGGPGGFHSRPWQVEQADARAASFSLVSPDGDQGYPGRMEARVSYRIVGPLTLEIAFEARVDAPSPVCLTNHAYFNLDERHGDVRGHRLRIAAQRYLPVNEALIPLGELADVQGSGFDFRTAKTIARDWLRDDPQQRHGGGFDHAFLLDAESADAASPAVELQAADGSLRMRVSTTLPSLQFYGGQFLTGIPDRNGQPYASCAGVALEPQYLPDSPNHPEWPQPSCWLQPGEVWQHRIRYEFVT
jgi:aldose 1-epimerase